MSAPWANDWMDRVAHDLRGPLAPMQTAVYLLREPAIGEAQRDELLAVLERQIQRLGAMIDEFDDIGRAQVDRLVGRRETIDIESLVAEIAERLGARPPQLSLAPEVRGFEIEGDALRIAQLFHALLGLRLARGQVPPVRARLDVADGCLRMTCATYCSGATDALVDALLTSPHPDPPDDTLGLNLMVAAAIARAHGGRMHGHASACDTAELVLELPAHGASPHPERARG